MKRMMIPLNEQKIRKHLTASAFNYPIHLHVLDNIDSTNLFLKTLPHQQTIDLCCAELQTAGRGRFGRAWYSPFGENIYCSIRWPITGKITHLPSLSLMVSLSLVGLLRRMNITAIQIKWPNDLLWQDRKLGGILVEMGADQKSVIVGIGLNVNSITADHPAPNKPWCSLYDITADTFDRNQLIAQCLHEINEPIQHVMTQGFSAFRAAWDNVDYLKGRLITVSQSTLLITGRAMGINEAGQLLLMDKAGTTHALSSGEASLQSD